MADHSCTFQTPIQIDMWRVAGIHVLALPRCHVRPGSSHLSTILGNGAIKDHIFNFWETVVTLQIADNCRILRYFEDCTEILRLWSSLIIFPFVFDPPWSQNQEITELLDDEGATCWSMVELAGGTLEHHFSWHFLSTCSWQISTNFNRFHSAFVLDYGMVIGSMFRQIFACHFMGS